MTLAPAGTPSWAASSDCTWLPVGACSAMDQAPGDICSLMSPLPLQLATHDLPAWSSETARPISGPEENDSSRKPLGAGEAEVGGITTQPDTLQSLSPQEALLLLMCQIHAFPRTLTASVSQGLCPCSSCSILSTHWGGLLSALLSL